MYCRYCGQELPSSAKFCTSCGAAQNGGPGEPPKKSKAPVVIICVLAILVAALIAVVSVILIGVSKKPAPAGDPGKNIRAAVPTVTTAPTSFPAPTLPWDGWYEEDGNLYYYEDGTPLTGLQAFDDGLFYFYEDGVMAANTTVDLEDVSLEFNADGLLVAYTIPVISGEWSSERFSFGNGGKATILELDTDVVCCRSMSLYLEASGLYGANVSGTWKVHIRSHGTWEYVQDISFTQPDGSFTIRFDTPKDFDAITLYPTVQGNATYNVYYSLYDVYCRL